MKKANQLGVEALVCGVRLLPIDIFKFAVYLHI